METKEKTYSWSEIKLWRRCHKAHDYKYAQGLQQKTPASPLIRGVIFHELVDARISGGNVQEVIDKYQKQYANLWDEQKEEYGSIDDIVSLYDRYTSHYSNEKLTYLEVNGRNSEIELKSEHDGIKFYSILDKVPQDENGLIWVMDHKTHRVFPDEDARFSDLQTVLYYWQLQQNGVKAAGVLWDYVRTKPPAVVEVLKKGGLTRRVNLDTDYDTYMQAIVENGLDPADYQEELDRASKNVYFKRVRLPHPPKVMVESVLTDFVNTAKEIESGNNQVRSLSKDCKMCSYYQLCHAEIRGHDADFLKKSLYTLRGERK
jgi:hypothetical protein